MRIYIRTCMHACMHARTRAHTHTHTHGLHSYTWPTYMHTYIFTIIMVSDSETYVAERFNFRYGTFEYGLGDFEA